jgi:hypothetical protein
MQMTWSYVERHVRFNQRTIRIILCDQRNRKEIQKQTQVSTSSVSGQQSGKDGLFSTWCREIVYLYVEE